MFLVADGAFKKQIDFIKTMIINEKHHTSGLNPFFLSEKDTENLKSI
jgi:hypothetical protein